MDIPRKLHATDAAAKGLMPLRIALDCEPVADVIRYDMDAGEVECCVRIDGYGLVMDGDEIATHIMHGVVTVERGT